MRFMALRLDWALAPRGQQADIIVAARWALSFALYGGVLFGLGYAALKGVFSPAAILCVSVLALAFTAGIGSALESWSDLSWPAGRVRTLGGQGLILERPQPHGGTVVLLRGAGEPNEARTLAVPGSPMVFLDRFSGGGIPLADLSPAALDGNTPRFLQNIAADLGSSADVLRWRLGEGLSSFLLYAGSLVFMLGSLAFVLKIGAWPLASLFMGAFAFRGALALEAFLNSRETQGAIASFLQGRADLSLAVPAIFLVIGLLVHLYSLLVYLSRRKGRHADA